MPDQRTDKRRRRRNKKSRARSPQESAIQHPTPNPQDEAQAKSAAPEDDIDASWFVRTANGGFRGQGTTHDIRRQLDKIDALAPGAALNFSVHPATVDQILAEEHEHTHHQDQKDQANIKSLASAVNNMHLSIHDVDMDVSPMPSTNETTTTAAAETPVTPEGPVTPANNHNDEESDDSNPEYAFVPYLAKKRGVGRRARPVPVKLQERIKERTKAREAQKLARAERAKRWSRRAHGSAE